jgi:hypothetical protein
MLGCLPLLSLVRDALDVYMEPISLFYTVDGDRLMSRGQSEPKLSVWCLSCFMIGDY